MRPSGTLHAAIEFVRVYPHAIEHVWDAITTEEGLRGWLMCTLVQIEPRVGGRIELISGPPQYRSTGVVLAWEPPRLLEYEWNVAPVPEMPHGERAVFRYELQARGEGTQLHVTYRRLSLHTARGFLPSLHAFLDRLEAQLEGAPLPDWLERLAEVREHYPEWHASDPGK